MCLWVSDFDIFGKEDMPNLHYLWNLCSLTPHWAATWLGDIRSLKALKDVFGVAAASQTPQFLVAHCRSTGLTATTGYWRAAQLTSGCCSCVTSNICRESWAILSELAAQENLRFWLLWPIFTTKSTYVCPSNVYTGGTIQIPVAQCAVLKDDH